jgi:Sigma-70, region 4
MTHRVEKQDNAPDPALRWPEERRNPSGQGVARRRWSAPPNRPLLISSKSWNMRYGNSRPEQREVILLVGLEGFSYEDAAKILAVPVGTVRSRLSRGRESLRRQFGIEEEIDPSLISRDGPKGGQRAGAQL